MRLSSFTYLVKQGWKNMAANRLMTLAGIGVLTACFLITGVAALLSLNVGRVVDQLAEENEITVFLYVDLDDAQAEAVGEQIRSLPNVKDALYTSKSDAFATMQEWMKDATGDRLAGMENVFPASYSVTVSDLNYIQQTNAQLTALSGVEYTNMPTDFADVMLTVNDFVTYGGMGIVVILLLVSLIVIGNTIRLTVFARRREISIMKYVGATNAFIRLPFFVEGMTSGVIAGLLATGVLCAGYYFVYEYLRQMYNVWVISILGNLLSLSDIWLPMGLCFVAAGFVLGGFGTATSVRKHLRV